jgi:outer membrane protein assembly factor BamB
VSVVTAVVAAFLGVPGASVGVSQEKPRTDWPQYRGPNRDGISAEKGWSVNWDQKGPKVLWKASLGGGYSSFSVVAGKVLTMGNTGGTDTVFCLKADSGQQVWKHSYSAQEDWGGYKGPHSTPTVDGNSVYVLSNDGQLFCLDLATGKVAWSKRMEKDFGASPPQWGFACSPLVLDKMLILDVGPTIALDKATGDRIWKSPDFSPAYSSPIAFELGKERFIASFNGSGLTIFKADDGKEVGHQRWETRYGVNAATPIVSDGKIFISSGYGTGCALFQAGEGKLKQLWKNKSIANHCNSCVLWRGCVYGFNDNVGGAGKLVCLDFATGQVKWRQDGLGTGSLMLADGKMIILSEGGELVIAEASPEGFKQLARAQVLGETCWTVPVLSGGRIYCRNHAGNMVCLDVNGK